MLGLFADWYGCPLCAGQLDPDGAYVEHAHDCSLLDPPTLLDARGRRADLVYRELRAQRGLQAWHDNSQRQKASYRAKRASIVEGVGVAVVQLTDEQKAQLEALRSRVSRVTEDKPVKLNPRHAPGDPASMRGIPMLVSGGVGGVITGTRPGDSALHLERDERHIAKYRNRRRPRD